MKAKYVFIGFLLAALVIGGAGYSVSAGTGGKVTGGGTFYHNAWPSSYADYGDKITFGFNAQGLGNSAKGQFNLVNHNSGMKVSGIISECSATTSWVEIAGTCSINGVSTSFWARFQDGGEGSGSYDLVRIGFGGTPWPSYDIYGQLFKGNMQKHK